MSDPSKTKDGGVATADEAKPAEKQPEQGLERRPTSSSPEVITTPAQFNDRLKLWTDRHYNVICAVTNFSALPPQYVLAVSVVQLNPDPKAGEVYGDPLWCKKASDAKDAPFTELAPTKTALRKLASAAGISITTQRTDPRTIQHFWEFKATATRRNIDGSVEVREATKEWDMRDGSAQIGKRWTPNQIQAFRANGLRHCESRAANAAVREFGIKQKYTVEELRKPFIVVTPTFVPDMTDPEQRKLVAQNALSGTAMLYQAPRQALPAPTDYVHDADVIEGEAATGSETKPAETAKDPADVPPNPRAVRIVKVETVTGTKGGKPWNRFDIIASDGTQRSTFSTTDRDAAKKYEAEKTWVELDDVQNGDYTNLANMAPAQPDLPMEAEGEY